jgi:perosamine synthetase
VFREFAEAACPVADDLCARHVCLPIHSDMALDEADTVVRALAATIR